MILEIREVSRKTPRDGRLEVTSETARRLDTQRRPLPLVVGTARGEADLDTLECQCGTGAVEGHGTAHRHHFVRSPLLMQLTVGESVVLELDAEGHLHVARPHDLRPS